METNSRPPTPALNKALAAAQKRAKAVEKDAKNEYHRYKYASAEAIIAEAREALSEEGLAVFPRSIDRDPAQPEHEWNDKGEIVVHRRVLARYQLLHESGEEKDFESSVPVIPEKGRPEDKAEFGSRTENLGYALRDLLLLPRVQEGAVQPSARDDSRDQGPRGPKPAPKPEAVDDGRTEVAMRLSKLLTAKAPEGLGWTKAGCLGWLKKRFGVEGTPAMSMQQLKDAQLLALAKMANEDTYKAKVVELAAAGRCLGDGEVAA